MGEYRARVEAGMRCGEYKAKGGNREEGEKEEGGGSND